MNKYFLHRSGVKLATIVVYSYILLLFSTQASSRVANEGVGDFRASITVAVASNFYFPLTQLLSLSDEWSKQNVRLVSGSSGVLYAQAVNGAPFDIFLSADAARPQALFEKQLSQAPISYARGKLVLWPSDESLSITQNLTESRGRIAIANPKTAPFGAAADVYMRAQEGYPQWSKRFVFGNNILQAFQFIDSANAAIGFVAESTLVQAQQKLTNKETKYLNYLPLPLSQYPAIIQQGVIIAPQSSPQYKRAERFMQYLLSQTSQQALLELGYTGVQP
jgi:molybdate transport system substrate-binding protein